MVEKPLFIRVKPEYKIKLNAVKESIEIKTGVKVSNTAVLYALIDDYMSKEKRLSEQNISIA